MFDWFYIVKDAFKDLNNNNIKCENNADNPNMIYDNLHNSKNKNNFNLNAEIYFEKNIENNKKDYRRFIISKLIHFTHKYKSLGPEIQKLFHDEDFSYNILDIILFSQDKEEKIQASTLLTNLTYISNDVIQSICDEKLIEALMEILNKNHQRKSISKNENTNSLDDDVLYNNIIIILGNIIINDSDFVLKKTNFLDFYAIYVEKSMGLFDSTKIWMNGILMNLPYVYMVNEKHEVIIF